MSTINTFGFSLFYKDIYGVSIPYDDKGHIALYPNNDVAVANLSRVKEELQNLLEPRIEYKTTRKHWWSLEREVVRIEPDPIPDWIATMAKQQLKTLYVKQVKLV